LDVDLEVQPVDPALHGADGEACFCWWSGWAALVGRSRWDEGLAQGLYGVDGGLGRQPVVQVLLRGLRGPLHVTAHATASQLVVSYTCDGWSGGAECTWARQTGGRAAVHLCQADWTEHRRGCGLHTRHRHAGTAAQLS
jgi:hypothetical protein